MSWPESTHTQRAGFGASGSQFSKFESMEQCQTELRALNAGRSKLLLSLPSLPSASVSCLGLVSIVPRNARSDVSNSSAPLKSVKFAIPDVEQCGHAV